MPTYYFDTFGTDGACTDDEGSECASTDAAGHLARQALCEIAGARCRDADPIAYTVRVRDLAGAGIYKATLTLVGMPGEVSPCGGGALASGGCA